MQFEQKKYDVLAIGSSIVDILSFSEEKFLNENQITKGIMTLIDEKDADRIYSVTGSSVEVSGGSAANTAAGVASMGGTAAFIGRIKDDELGKIFNHDLNAVGVKYQPKPAKSGKATARSFIFVTPDADRTMLTYLGACTEFNESDLDEELIKNSKVVYVEGYLWDTDGAKAAIRKAFTIAKANGVKTSFSLSDPFCVGRHRAEFLDLLKEIDILFCNEEEVKSLFETNDLGEAIEKISELCDVTSITTGPKGSVVVYDSTVKNVAAGNIEKLVDTTGAGDLYAAGFLYGVTSGKTLEESGELGNKAAAAIIQQLGARAEKPLKNLLAA